MTAAQLAPTDAVRAWEPFQPRTGGNTDLFLIADEVVRHERLTALGACRWAAVIDLDPQSDKTGVSSVVEPVLRELRHVSVFGENAEVTSPEVATNWLMANGWASHGEVAATSADDWRRRGYLPRVRRLIDWVRDETPRTRAAVLCLRSGKHDAEIDRVIDYIDERYGGIDTQLELVQPSASEGIDLAWFLSIVGESRPAVSSFIPFLPGIDGQWRVRWADLYRLSVDLEVLHSEVLSQSRDGLLPSDEFWRGRPPTWGELDAGVDIPRAIFPSLHADLRKRLEDHQLAVIHLAHSPGAGGTTLARRIAWSLHQRFPTVLLRAYSSGTIERVDEIYQETGLPVLMIAESADLPESELDELRQGLLQRNSRAVILWVNRTAAQVASRRAGPQRYTLLDPLSDTERGWFFTEYRRRAETRQARELLDELAAGSATVVPPQRLSPFYFGLCVYDAQFVGVTDYVRNHLLNLSAAQLPVARYLALITRYGQQFGLPVDFTQHLLGADRPMFEALTDEQLRDTLGPDLRHLVVQRDSSLRLLHPLIAGEVLNAGIDGVLQGQVPDALRFAEPEREIPQSRATRPAAQSTSTAASKSVPTEPTIAGTASATADPPKNAPAVVPAPSKPRRRQASPLVVPPRRPDAGDDYQGFILALLRDANEHGEVLRSLELGEALQMQFGRKNYERFRKEGLRKAVEQLGFRTVHTAAGFDVELP